MTDLDYRSTFWCNIYSPTSPAYQAGPSPAYQAGPSQATTANGGYRYVWLLVTESYLGCPSLSPHAYVGLIVSFFFASRTYRLQPFQSCSDEILPLIASVFPRRLPQLQSQLTECHATAFAVCPRRSKSRGIWCICSIQCCEPSVFTVESAVFSGGDSAASHCWHTVAGCSSEQPPVLTFVTETLISRKPIANVVCCHTAYVVLAIRLM